MHILVVDDEPAVRDSLRRSLTFNGYQVGLASDGVAALSAISERQPDAVVLDVAMPKLDGLSTCRALRASGNDVPVLVLTARDAVSDRVAGLDAGADDYLVKPFALEELLARLRALLRRTAPAADGSSQMLSYSDLSLDRATREVYRGDRELSLTRTEFSLLELLLRHPRIVLDRALILDEVWGFDFATTANSLEVYVGYLRRKTEFDGESRLIHTVRGVGYVLRDTPPVSIVDRLGFGPTMTLRKRIGMLAALAAGISVLIVSVATYWAIRIALTHQVDTSLLARANAVVAAAQADPDTIGQWTDVSFGAADIRVEFVLADGNNPPHISNPRANSLPDLQRSPSQPDQPTPEEKVALGELESSVRTVGGLDPDDTAKYRVVAVPYPSRFNLALVISQPLTDTRTLVNRIGLLMAGLSVAGVAIAAWAGFAVARSGLRPIAELTDGAEQVARTGELRPVPVRGTDELARLATSFNTMLGALGAVRERERRLIADAGHELRTPLTSMRTNLDLLAQSDASTDGHHLSAEDRTAIVADVRAQIEELTVLIGDLVELSRDTPVEQRVPVDLAEIVGRSVERVQRRAPSLRFAVEAMPWPMIGDPQLLERAVTNLLDNAAKWSPDRGTVAVSLHEGVLSVADQGPGVATQDLPHVFDRFYRSEEARSKPGSGLGLSIVAQAAARHGGSVTATRSPSGGAEFLLRLPPAPTGPMGMSADEPARSADYSGTPG